MHTVPSKAAGERSTAVVDLRENRVHRNFHYCCSRTDSLIVLSEGVQEVFSFTALPQKSAEKATMRSHVQPQNLTGDSLLGQLATIAVGSSVRGCSNLIHHFFHYSFFLFAGSVLD